MAKVIISKSYGAGFYFANKKVYDWLITHGGEDLVLKQSNNNNCMLCRFASEDLRYHPLVIQCIEELGRYNTGYDVVEYDEVQYDIELGDYDGMEWIDLIPVLDVELMTTMTAAELAAYLDDKGIHHNYGR